MWVLDGVKNDRSHAAEMAAKIAEGLFGAGAARLQAVLRSEGKRSGTRASFTSMSWPG
jgi:hypothetical protein